VWIGALVRMGERHMRRFSLGWDDGPVFRKSVLKGVNCLWRKGGV
jgi:hypothetical protein